MASARLASTRPALGLLPVPPGFARGAPRLRKPPLAWASMSPTSPPSLLVLLGLRLAGFRPADVVAAAAGLPQEEVAALLEGFAATGLATHRSGRFNGWSLTPAGRAEGERLLAAELDDAGCRVELERCYRDFLQLNGLLLALCTDWQMTGPETLNDHTDAAYDDAVVGRLVELDGAAQPVCWRLAACIGRYGGYGRRLAHALSRVRDGERDWFTKPMIASYHTVWFELHEDLLATLNLDRAAETTR